MIIQGKRIMWILFLLLLCTCLQGQSELVRWNESKRLWRSFLETELQDMTKFGRNQDVDSAAPEDVWDVGGDFPIFLDDSTVTVVSSDADDDTSGGGALKLTVVGLDSGFAKISEAVYLNGLTAVSLTNSYRIIYRAWVDSTEGDNNVGSITFSSPGSVSMAMISAGLGQTLMTVYCVEAGKKAIVTHLNGSLNQNSATAGLNFLILIKDLNVTGSAWRVRKVIGTDIAGSSFLPYKFENPIVLTAGQIIKTRVSVDANNVDVSAELIMDLQNSVRFTD